jgi:subtilisin family serine protease
MLTQSITANGRSLIVASAGNRSSDRPFYPAAFDGVLAVGSLDLNADRDGSAWTSPTRAGPRSEFSNYGPWVDAWAGGEKLVTHHVADLAFYAGGPVLEGVAEVSGTSFAAPAVAALLAEGVALTGRSADWVWTHLLRPTGTRCPASGGGVAVALTSMRAPFFLPGFPVRRSPC